MIKQFIVNESDLQKREEFYNYITDNYNLKISYPFDRERFINNNFPFVVDFEDESFWICESVTCCAAAASNHVIITIDEFKSMIRRR